MMAAHPLRRHRFLRKGQALWRGPQVSGTGMLSAIVRARCGATAVLHRTSALLIVKTFGCGITIMTQERNTKIPPGEVQLCPKCQIPMSVSDVFPTMPTTGLMRTSWYMGAINVVSW